jgi:hypothetical protein
LAKTLPPVSNAVDVLSETPAAARIAAYRRARDGQTILPGEMQK